MVPNKLYLKRSRKSTLGWWPLVGSERGKGGSGEGRRQGRRGREEGEEGGRGREERNEGRKEGRKGKQIQGEGPLSDETMLCIQKKEIKQHKDKIGKEK